MKLPCRATVIPGRLMSRPVNSPSRQSAERGLAEHPGEVVGIEDLLNQVWSGSPLARTPSTRPWLPTTSFYYKGKQIPIGEIARSLGVTYLLDGSVRKSGVRLRVAARLIRADNGYVIWSETYDRPLHDILMVKDDIAGEVTKALRASIENPTGPLWTPLTSKDDDRSLGRSVVATQIRDQRSGDRELLFLLDYYYGPMSAVYDAIQPVALDLPGDTDPLPLQLFLGTFAEKITFLYWNDDCKYLVWRRSAQKQIRSRVVPRSHIRRVDDLTTDDLTLTYIFPCFFGGKRPRRFLRNGKAHREEYDRRSPLVTHTRQCYTVAGGENPLTSCRFRYAAGGRIRHLKDDPRRHCPRA
jgi:hypothetical protein